MHVTFRASQRGFGIAYILSFIAILSVVIAALAMLSRDNAQARLNLVASTAILDQVQLIRNRILVCGVQYPTGDNLTGIRTMYPATPGSLLLSDAVCPGQPAPNNLWTGSNGLILPPPPAGFSPWRYENDNVSMRIESQPLIPGQATALGIFDILLPRLGSGASRNGNVLSIILMH
jgi:hypothetical protein